MAGKVLKKAVNPDELWWERLALAIVTVSLPVTAVFCIVNAVAKDKDGLVISLVVLGVMATCLVLVKQRFRRTAAFFGSFCMSLAFLIVVALGAGGVTSLFWIYMMPPAYFIFLGLRTGFRALGLFTAGLCVLMFWPDLLHTHAYEGYLVWRFCVTYLLVVYLSYAFESARMKFQQELSLRHDEVRKQKDFLETLMKTLPCAVYFKDDQGRYQGCNPAFETLTQQSRQRIVGQTLFDIIPTDIAGTHHEKDKALLASPGQQVYEGRMVSADGKARHVVFHKSTFTDESGRVRGIVGAVQDITGLKTAQAEKDKLIHELETALGEIKTLSGLLPICSACKKIRDDQGYWSRIETYIEQHSQALFTHSICPECAREFYRDQTWDDGIMGEGD